MRKAKEQNTEQNEGEVPGQTKLSVHNLLLRVSVTQN
jgi:hypothetical protein